MIFTKNQVSNLMNIIDFTTSMFIVTQMGEDVLSSYDKYIFNKFGFDINKIVEKYPPYLQSFMFGRLTSWLSDNQASQIAYKDFEKYLKSGQYFPLTTKEQNLYDISINRSYGHIKNLAEKRKGVLQTSITEEDVRREISEGIKNRTSKQRIISNWGNKTGDWQRDYLRIAETEHNDIFQLGRVAQIEERSGNQAQVYKHVFPGACRHCIRLYMNGGVNGVPKLFTVEELMANGTNIGRKVADWLPVVGSTHPFCRCNNHEKDPDERWDEEKHQFVLPEKYEQKIKRTKKNKLTVGDKVFWV